MLIYEAHKHCFYSMAFFLMLQSYIHFSMSWRERKQSTMHRNVELISICILSIPSDAWGYNFEKGSLSRMKSAPQHQFCIWYSSCFAIQLLKFDSRESRVVELSSISILSSEIRKKRCEKSLMWQTCPLTVPRTRPQIVLQLL